MPANTLPRTGLPGPTSWLLLGGTTLGSLDILFAFAFWAPQGVTLTRILQSIAAGLLGRPSYEGGIATAWLGAGLHYFIATMMVLACYLVARRFPGLLRRPLVFGPLYGLLLYGVMNFIVLPLSAAGTPDFANAAWVTSSIAMHAVFGWICFVFARRALAASRP
ncbi:hypothetical protein IP90_01761 [Luteimonas cucumeris]|uniref:DUF1440 domain-containing protein n=1 Tax=Luteimonas cucumeris TaxID=985012 RepID=A0A562L5F9_9GAMM|nr:hypothetical protein [Luteimonas cucumeris]TWI02664.1 hypothetical protein IP90_01761 [Luteimonas cucumeris]